MKTLFPSNLPQCFGCLSQPKRVEIRLTLKTPNLLIPIVIRFQVRDAGELRVKESDRIASIVTNLRAMGAEVEELEDGLKIPGGQTLHGAEIDSYGDHRIAMAFAVAALRAEGETTIHRADAAVISCPGFFGALEALSKR